jgi:hypothetical protein
MEKLYGTNLLTDILFKFYKTTDIVSSSCNKFETRF